MFSSCGVQDDKNPDEWFDEMYWWDTTSSSEAANKIEKKSEIDQLAMPNVWDIIAIMETSMWTMKIRLFEKQTPKSVENFVGLSKKSYYDGIIFHRIIPNFMIQWWDPTGTGRGWQSIFWTTFEDEPHPNLKNIKWALSMANRGPNTNGSQFFIVQAPATPHLDWYQKWIKTCWEMWRSCHTVFGQVYEWIDIVDKIAAVKTNPMDKPLKDVVINTIKIEEYK